jgi:hypothetical protein
MAQQLLGSVGTDSERLELSRGLEVLEAENRSFTGLVRETETGVIILSSSRSVDAIGFRLLEASNES